VKNFNLFAVGIILFAIASDIFSASDNTVSQGEFLDPKKAFQYSVNINEDGNIRASWKISPGYYMYKDKFKFKIDSEGTALERLEFLNDSHTKNDKYFGSVEVFRDYAEILIPYSSTGAKYINLSAVYQGCADAGLCYPPITTKTKLKIQNNNLPASLNNGLKKVANDSEPISFQSEQYRIASTLASGKLWFTVLSFFGLGLLLAFTPCVFPMIPILSSIIVGQGKKISTSKAFTLSLIYVLAMAVTYTVAGVIVGLSGENIQIWFQNPWVLSVFAGIFVLLSFSMFGFYELQMPNAVQSKLNMISSNQQQGSYIGAGIMGFLSALIVGPCVTAPLIGALIYIANTGDALIGGIALFALSMGMGAPLLAIGTSAGKILPKAGAWMDAVKAVFGVMMLGLAIWLLERVLPAAVILLMAGALLIVSAIYMGALETIKDATSGWHKLWKGLGLISLVYGAILVIGAAGGSHSLLQPLQGIAAQHSASDNSNNTNNIHALPFQQVKGVEGLNAAVQQAAQDGRPVMLDFYADWCVSCKEMESFTFSDASVQDSLNNFVILQSDVTNNDAQDKALLKELGLFGPPAILFYDSSGNELRKDANDFSSHIESFKQSGTFALND